MDGRGRKVQNHCVEVIERFRASQIAAGKSEQTAKTYAHAVSQFGRWLEQNGGAVEAPTRHDVQSYVTWMVSRGKSPVTIEKVFAALTAYAEFLHRPEIVQEIRRPPVRKVRNVAPKSLERNERNRLLRAVEQSGNLRDTAIVYMLLYAGLRVSELCGLDREDVVLSDRKGTVHVRRGKGDVARNVPLAHEARFHLSRYLESRKDDNPALFVSGQGRRISARTVEWMLKRYGTYPHALRHTFCRTLVSNGVDLATVAELAGHADVNMTRRYAKPSQEELERAVEGAFSS